MFGTYWASGNAAAHGADPYIAYPQSHIFNQGTELTVRDINLNPPLMLPVFELLSHLSIHGFAVAWSIVSATCLAMSVLLLLQQFQPQTRQLLWLCLCSAALDTILAGQIYFLLLLLSTLGLIALLRDRESTAAVAIGLLVAIKPTTIFWPLFLAASGRKGGLKSIAVAAVASLVPLPFYGTHVYLSWLNAIRNDTHWMQPTDIALPAYFARAGWPHVGLIIALSLAALLTVAVWKFRPSFIATTGIGLCVAILCSPLAWPAYVVLLAPAFVARKWNRLGNVTAAILAIPGPIFSLVFRANHSMLAAGLTYSLGVWLMLGYFTLEAVRVDRLTAVPIMRRYFSPEVTDE